jgi:hypothetical protein
VWFPRISVVRRRERARAIPSARVIARNRGVAETRVLGTEFYDSIRRMPVCHALRSGREGVCDIQRIASSPARPAEHWLRCTAGSLSTYVVWIVLAIVVLIAALVSVSIS